MPPVPIALQPVLRLLSRPPRPVQPLVPLACQPRVRRLPPRHRLRLAPLAPRVVRGLPVLVLLALRGRRQAPAINRR